MSLIINKVSSGSSQIRYSYLTSDEVFGYDISATYTIQFTDVAFTQDDGVLLEGIEAIRAAYLRQNIVARIGADEFVNGRITACNFEESAQVGSNSCSITIEESKRLNSYSSSTFAQHIPSPQWMESFDENFNFTRDAGKYSFSRTVSLKYKQDAGDQFLSNARLFLRNFYFTARPSFGFQTDGISEDGRFNGGFRPVVSETFDLINLGVSISENLESSVIDGDHSVEKSYSLEVDQGGFLQKRYSIAIKALKEPLERVAETACRNIIADIISDNTAEFGEPFEIGRGIQKDGGLISINISFSNNPSLNSDDTISYSVVKNRRDSFFDYAISAELYSKGQNQIEKALNVRTFWQSQSPTYETKIQSLFSEADPIYEQSRSFSFQYLDAKISETAVFTTDSAYNTASLPAGITKLKFSNAFNPKIDRTRTFVDLVDRREKIEVSELSTIGKGAFSIEAVAYKSKGLNFLRDYLANLSFNVGQTTYKNSDEITLNDDGSASRVISYEFT